jgi:shikimate kinase
VLASPVMTTPDPPLALIGPMGAGKTAVARRLGERLATSVADLDAMLEAEEGVSIAALFAREGEPWFRRREGDLLRETLSAGARVIACGGGIVLDPEHRRMLRERCRAVWLDVSPAEAARRLGADVATRPLLSGGEPVAALARIAAARAPLYAECAWRRVATDGLGPDAVAAAIERELAAGAAR